MFYQKLSRTLLVALFSLTFFTFSLAQRSHNLKGPKAKNNKPWNNSTIAPPKPVINVFDSKQTGPKVKNVKPWTKGQHSAKKMIVRTRNEPKLIGPKAKNRKH